MTTSVGFEAVFTAPQIHDGGQVDEGAKPEHQVRIAYGGTAVVAGKPMDLGFKGESGGCFSNAEFVTFAKRLYLAPK